MVSDSAQKCGGVQKKMIATMSQAFSGAVALAAKLFVGHDRADAKRLFGFSIFYLFALFAALLVEHLAGLKPLALLAGLG